MDSNNVLGELLEKGQNVASAAVSDVTDSVSNQIGLKNETVPQQTPQTQNQTQAEPHPGLSQNSIEESQRTEEMVRDFYSPSDDQVQNNAQTVANREEQQLAQVRQKLFQELHNETYYEPLISYEHNKQQAESKTDQLKRQDKQEMQELQQKEADKPPPLAVRRAQTHTEMNPGIAG